MDVIYFKIFKSKNVDNDLIKFIDNFENKKIPIMPIKAEILMKKYNILEGKEMGIKLKAIEEFWSNNNFLISDQEVRKIIND